MGKNLLNSFKIGTIVYLFLVIINLIVELFSIKESGEVVTFFGIRIISKITPEELNTTFLWESRLLVTYILTILIFFSFTQITSRFKER